MPPVRDRGHASRERLAFLAERPFAHRGLHGLAIPENSLAAARAAIAGGYGIECDVRLSRDGEPHVFHDRRLERLTGEQCRFGDLDADAIARLRLKGTSQAPPTLAALLALCVRAPLLIEIKSDGDMLPLARLCAAVAAELASHPGPVAVMSFDSRACHWFARHAPQVVRGLVVSRRYRHGIMSRRTKALAIARARPHFLACDVRDLPQAATRPGDMPLLCWTVRTPAQRALAASRHAQIVFEAAPA